MPKSLTTEEYVSKCIARMGNKYSYLNTVYKTDCETVTVTCPVHGDFDIHKKKHLSRGDGCPECSGRRMNTERAIGRSKAVHGNDYRYDKFVFINSHALATITCPKEGHGDFQQSYSSHVHAKAGCPRCAGCERGTTGSFTQKAVEEHGTEYDYSEVEYVNDKTKVSVICKIHGAFKIAPTNHLQGVGCKRCSKNGYNVSKPGCLYVLTSDDTTKVGITNRDVLVRLKEIRRSSGKNFKLELFITFRDGDTALKIERSLLRNLRENYRQPQEVYDGSTEAFSGVPYNRLLLNITNLCGEFLSA